MPRGYINLFKLDLNFSYMKTNERAEQIADRYASQIRFVYAGFYDSEASPFPATLRLEIPTKMLIEYASLKCEEIPQDIFLYDFLSKFWLETRLAEKLMAHKDVRRMPSDFYEIPIDMLEYLIGNNVCVHLSEIPAKSDLKGESVEIRVYDIPDLDEDQQA